MAGGPISGLAFAAALIATLAWALCNWKPQLWPTLGMLAFGFLLALVVLIGGPLVRLP